MPAKKKQAKAYAGAGVDLALADRVKGGLKRSLKRASRPEVLGAAGGFGGLFDISKLAYRHPVLVSSIDGVGTKLKLAFESGKHKGVGKDIVNHCLNDIAVVGAEPLFFLDYLGLAKLDPGVFRQLVAGMAEACAAANCALIGGETAQMPGFYAPGEYDLAGAVVGVAEKSRLLSGETVRAGDALIGLPSSGLHTNGFSLARKALFEQGRLDPNDPAPGARRKSLLNALLAPHACYAPLLLSLLRRFNCGRSFKVRKGNAVFAAAHITGGGFPGNLPRVLPEAVDAVVETASWKPPALFRLIQEAGRVPEEEMYEVFNMGMGLVLVVDEPQADAVVEACRAEGCRARRVGRVAPGAGRARLA